MRVASRLGLDTAQDVFWPGLQRRVVVRLSGILCALALLGAGLAVLVAPGLPAGDAGPDEESWSSLAASLRSALAETGVPTGIPAGGGGERDGLPGKGEEMEAWPGDGPPPPQVDEAPTGGPPAAGAPGQPSAAIKLAGFVHRDDGKAFALLETAGGRRIVQVGDEVDAWRVTVISGEGVELVKSDNRLFLMWEGVP